MAGRWFVLDTRQMTPAMQHLVDGYVHVMPQRSMHKHWVQHDCWCEPVSYWSVDAETVVVKHRRKVPKAMEHVDG